MINILQPPKLSKADRERLKREDAERRAREEGKMSLRRRPNSPVVAATLHVSTSCACGLRTPVEEQRRREEEEQREREEKERQEKEENERRQVTTD